MKAPRRLGPAQALGTQRPGQPALWRAFAGLASGLGIEPAMVTVMCQKVLQPTGLIQGLLTPAQVIPFSLFC